MSSIDYGTIALITIFTSFFAGLGQEIAKEIVQWIRKGRKKIASLKSANQQ
jgi:hypothetical protein